MNANRRLTALLLATCLAGASSPVLAAEPGRRQEQRQERKHVKMKTRVAGVLLGAIAGAAAGGVAGKLYNDSKYCHDDDGCIPSVIRIISFGAVAGAVSGYFVSGSLAANTERALAEGRERVRLAHSALAAATRSEALTSSR